MNEKLEKSKVSKIPTGGLERMTVDGVFHLNRCNLCGRLITKMEVLALFEGRRPLPLCPCGSNAIRPSNPKWWEYMLPRVIKLMAYILAGKVQPGEAR